MVDLVVPAGVTSYSIGGTRADIPAGAKTVTVEAAEAEVLKSHGFYPVGSEPAAALSLELGAVHVPRPAALVMLKHLGVAMADSVPPQKIVEALAEASRRQGERLAREVELAEQRGRSAASRLVTDVKKQMTEAEVEVEAEKQQRTRAEADAEAKRHKDIGAEMHKTGMVRQNTRGATTTMTYQG